ncbi:MAG: glycoside hydrolase family 140 protein [Eubacteriales bacterium]|jgi:hypothetical protein|nr:DUF4038 domain-containing protein [Clostridiales bacterium]
MRRLKTLGRYLSWDDGSPFFYLADTAWELLHALSREEMDFYFECRARQGFTAVQCVALAENDGLRTPNFYGRLPLKIGENGMPDPAAPDTDGEYCYWSHVDYAVDVAAKHDIFIVLLPTWGDKFNRAWGKGPEIFDEQNAFAYGKWLGERYSKRPNIIWMLGGDRALEKRHRAIIDAMAAGIKSAGDTHLMTFHPVGCRTSVDFVGDADYIDFHTAQTSHGIDQCYASDRVMLKMAAATAKPYMDSEPRYEDHPACFNTKTGYYWDSSDVRQNAYWNVLSGACGHTYGNHCIWSMTREPSEYFPYTWREALIHEGAEQMIHLKRLRLSRDYFSLQTMPGLVCDNYAGMGHMVAAAGEGYAYVYSPLGIPFTFDPAPLRCSGPLRASWYNPRTGEEKIFGVLNPREKTMLAPPTQGKGCDWVLVVEGI